MNWGVSGCVRVRVYPVNAIHPFLSIYVHILFGSLYREPSHGNILSTSHSFLRESFEVTVSGGSTFARVKLKEIDGMAPQDVERAV